LLLTAVHFLHCLLSLHCVSPVCHLVNTIRNAVMSTQCYSKYYNTNPVKLTLILDPNHKPPHTVSVNASLMSTIVSEYLYLYVDM